jgi:hypothetical protein
MAYLVFGFSVGFFICGLIEKFHKKGPSWTKSSYLFMLSGLAFIFAVTVGWPILQQAFS